ncbi:MAG TPA: HYR domain-containing protein, partial [Myxococcaceae bacterium]|nr:HYR domain-containing protein [Myxococcaceae bacterium]
RLVMELPAGVTVERTFAASGQHYLVVDEGPGGKALWRTDGTDAGTVKLSGNLASFSHAITVGSKLFFALPRPDASLEMWASDGTAAGTVKALEVTNPTPGETELRLASHVATNNQLYLSIHTVQNGARGPLSVQLWRADGTAKGSVKLVGPQLPEQGVEPPNLVAVNGTVVFGAKDPDGTSPDKLRGQELWQSNGTRGGTFLIQELDLNGSSNPHAFAIAGSKIFFVARGTNSGFTLWALPVACVPAKPAPPREPPPPPPATGIRCPSDMVVEATGPDGAEVRFAATAINGPTPAYDHEPGSRFPLGVTQVTASTNGTNGPTHCSFTVTVRDTTAPQIFCAEHLWVRTWKPGDAEIQYAEVGAWDAVSIPEVTYSQPPGSLFSEGTNEVVATATDAMGNQASCVLSITVQPITCAASPGSVSLWMLLAAAPLLWLRARVRRQNV